uniref:Putative secreted protein n=1 Tax=Ixodes ricinus TaxID=34613 RepID=A0A6B0TTZ1_IXORI
MTKGAKALRTPPLSPTHLLCTVFLQTVAQRKGVCYVKLQVQSCCCCMHPHVAETLSEPTDGVLCPKVGRDIGHLN